jgi:type I restriction enzyme, S subunit
MNGDLPEGWVLARISDVTDPVRSAKPEDCPSRIFSYVDISAIDNSTFAITELKQFRGEDAPSRARRPIRANDVLFSNVRTYLRNVALVPEGLNADLCSTGFTVLRPNAAVMPRYLFRYVLSGDFIDRVTPQQTGTHYPATSDRVVMGQSILLPPMAEQQRIVATLEKTIDKVDAARRRLETTVEILKRFRRSVLAAACSGNLTADWRAENPDIKPVSVPLSKANEYRKSSVEAANRKAGRNQFRYAPAAEIDVANKTKGIDGLFDLPDTWQWASLGQLTWSVTDGPHFSPKYVDPKDGIPFISGRNISYNGINFLGAKYISPKDHEEFSRRAGPAVGDVLLTKGGTTGVAAVVRDPREFSVWVHVAVLKVVRRLVTPSFLRDALSSPVVYAQSQAQTHGVGNQDLGLTRMVHMALPLPPLKEQEEIVRRVKALFALADRIQERVEVTRSHLRRLTPALLAKAFRGELVPTEAELARQEGRHYESTLGLIEQIRRERTVPTDSASEMSAKRRLRTTRPAIKRE